jgi:hypothetical protein
MINGLISLCKCHFAGPQLGLNKARRGVRVFLPERVHRLWRRLPGPTFLLTTRKQRGIAFFKDHSGRNHPDKGEFHKITFLISLLIPKRYLPLDKDFLNPLKPFTALSATGLFRRLVANHDTKDKRHSHVHGSC